jgi:hypothetical protein
MLIVFPCDIYPVIYLYFAAGQNFCEYSLSGHDTIPDCIKDVASAVADLTDLSDLQ